MSKSFPQDYTRLTPVAGTEKIPAARLSDGKMFYIVLSDITAGLVTSSQLAGYQEKLNSGTNLKTVGGESLLGSGNIPFPESGSSETEESILEKLGIPSISGVNTGDQELIIEEWTAGSYDEGTPKTHNIGGVTYLFLSSIDDNTSTPALPVPASWIRNSFSGFLSAWNNSVSYSTGAYITGDSNSKVYRSKVNSNLNHIPAGGVTTTYWEYIGNYIGFYHSGSAYSKGDFIIVEAEDDQTYISLKDNNTDPLTMLGSSGTWQLVGADSSLFVLKDGTKVLSEVNFSLDDSDKLDGIQSGATSNDTNANLKNRANHTGTQSADTITDGTTNKVYTGTEKTKLEGVATGATANSADATLLNRANHTGTQAATTISEDATHRFVTDSDKSTWNAAAGGGVGLGETSTTAYRGDRGKTAYDHSQVITGNPHGTTKADIGLGSVDNTPDSGKPVSTAQASAIALKAPIASPTFTGTVGGITATMVGLGNVNNTSDSSKPVSTAQQTAIDAKVANDLTASTTVAPSKTAINTALALKAPLASPTFTGTPAAPTATKGTNTTQLATMASVYEATTQLQGIRTPTANDTLVLADAGKLVQLNSATAVTETVPPNSSVPFVIGTQILLEQLGTGIVTVTAGAGVTINSSGGKTKTSGQYAVATLIKVGTDLWLLSGDLTT